MLQESDQERKEIRNKYIALGEKVEVLLNQERHNKSNADRDTEAAKMAVKEAVADLDAVRKLHQTSAATWVQRFATADRCWSVFSSVVQSHCKQDCYVLL